MQIVVYGGTEQKQEFLSRHIPETISVHWYNGTGPLLAADAYFDLSQDERFPVFGAVTDRPVFVHAVLTTTDQLAPGRIRINAWKGFFQRDIMEIAGSGPALARAALVLDALQWKYQAVPDKPGMIAARVIAMVINEAFFGLGEGLADKAAIDTAMKLGTNYPYGPFEWAEKIGLVNIHTLLKKLQDSDQRYTIAPALTEAIQTQNP